MPAMDNTLLMAFTALQSSRLTGLTPRQLSYWDRTGFFRPQYLRKGGKGAFGRVYSFRDLVGLKTVAIMLKEHHIPLQQLRRLGEWLGQRYDTPWSQLRFCVAGRELFFEDQASGQLVRGSRPAGQAALRIIELKPIADDLAQAAKHERERTPDEIAHVEQKRYIQHNLPVVAGTRIPTRAIWEFHQAGYTFAQIISEYPQLAEEDIHAAIRYEESVRTQTG